MLGYSRFSNLLVVCVNIYLVNMPVIFRLQCGEREVRTNGTGVPCNCHNTYHPTCGELNVHVVYIIYCSQASTGHIYVFLRFTVYWMECSLKLLLCYIE